MNEQMEKLKQLKEVLGGMQFRIEQVDQEFKVLNTQKGQIMRQISEVLTELSEQTDVKSETEATGDVPVEK